MISEVSSIQLRGRLEHQPEQAAIQLDIAKFQADDLSIELLEVKDSLFTPDSTRHVLNALDEFSE